MSTWKYTLWENFAAFHHTKIVCALILNTQYTYTHSTTRHTEESQRWKRARAREWEGRRVYFSVFKLGKYERRSQTLSMNNKMLNIHIYVGKVVAPRIRSLSIDGGLHSHTYTPIYLHQPASCMVCLLLLAVCLKATFNCACKSSTIWLSLANNSS